MLHVRTLDLRKGVGGFVVLELFCGLLHPCDGHFPASGEVGEDPVDRGELGKRLYADGTLVQADGAWQV
ncbi:MAG: hypothetical protein WCH31_05380 [Actinomycetes bacterium]